MVPHQVIMPEELHANPIPEDVSITTLRGEIEFTCCGLRQKRTGDNLTHVKCERCQYLFILNLVPSRLAPDEIVTGTIVRLKGPVLTKLGCNEVTLNPGLYKVYEDVHGMMGTLENETLVCVESRGFQGKMRTLVAPVPTDLLEIEETPDVDDDGSEEATDLGNVPL